jgi:hypothetical protein
MLDPLQCFDMPSYVVDSASGHLFLTEGCLAVLIRELCLDICSIRDPSLFNRQIPGIQARLSERISAALLYSCRFWLVHWLEHIRAAGPQSKVPLGLDKFCTQHLLHWIESLSLLEILNDVRRVMDSLLAAIKVGLTFWCMCMED